MTLNSTANKTSARLLRDYATQKWGTQSDGTDPGSERLALIIQDLYIKARSYAIINKTTFWLSILAGVLVLAWPAIAAVWGDSEGQGRLLDSAILQTTITGLAALTFAVYSHYKKRQVSVENLMRHIIYSGEPDQALIEKVLKEMERIDAGFSFSEATPVEHQPES